MTSVECNVINWAAANSSLNKKPLKIKYRINFSYWVVKRNRK